MGKGKQRGTEIGCDFRIYLFCPDVSPGLYSKSLVHIVSCSWQLFILFVFSQQSDYVVLWLQHQGAVLLIMGMMMQETCLQFDVVAGMRLVCF